MIYPRSHRRSMREAADLPPRSEYRSPRRRVGRATFGPGRWSLKTESDSVVILVFYERGSDLRSDALGR